VIIAHTSHPEAVELVQRERLRGGNIWIESCPQYFFLKEAEVLQHGALRKFTPPARLADDDGAARMWQLLAQGQITHISTDHAPATRAQKQTGDIWQAPFGLPGVETTLTLMLHAAHQGWVTLERVVEVLCDVPARLYGYFPRKGTPLPGADADIVLVDPARSRVIRDDQVISKAGWSPYSGMTVVGGPVMTFSRGRLVARDGKPLGEPGWGRWLPGAGAGSPSSSR
jgi:dihydroorotase-like cyclic amidohydrolase